MNNSNSDEISRAKGLILENKEEEALKFIQKAVDKAWGYFYERNYKEALSLALKVKELHEKIGYRLGIANILHLLGLLYLFNGDYDKGLECGLKSLRINEKLENQEEIAKSLYLTGFAYNYKGKFNQAIDYLKRCLDIEKILPQTKVDALYNLGVIYFWKGNFDQSLKYCEKSLKIAEEIDRKNYIAMSLNTIGGIYQLKGEIKKAKEYHIRSLSIGENQRLPLVIGLALQSLLIIAVLGESNLEEAMKLTNRIRAFSEEFEKSKFLNHNYLLGKAMIALKLKSRIQDRAEAELLLKRILTDKISHPPTHIWAIIFLCEFLLEELKISGNLTVLDELNPLVNRLLNISEKTHSYIWLVQAKLIQSKLALIQMDFRKAKLFLAQAQQIAESNDLVVYAQIISNDHDHLLEQQDMWEHLKKTKAPMADRIDLASFDGIITQMQGLRTLEPEVLVDEQAILLLIIAEGGVLLFSYPFSEEWKFDDELFGGFLNAFNSISDEIFSEGLDRVKFGKQTVLMENVGKFSFCYLFKGQTYPAKQKFDKFIDRIHESSSIFKTLENYYRTSQIAELEDIPSIEPLIEEIFYKRSNKIQKK